MAGIAEKFENVMHENMEHGLGCHINLNRNPQLQ